MSIISQQVSEPLHANVGGKVVAVPSSIINLHQRENWLSVLPRSAPSATSMQTSAGTEVIVDLPHSGGIDEVDMIYLSMVISNTDSVNNLNILDGFTMIDYVELQNRGVPVQRIYGLALRKLMCLTTSDEKATMILKAANLNPTTFVPLNNIAANGSYTMRVPIPILLSTGRIPMWKEEHEWRLIIKLKGGSDVILSTAGAAVTSLQISSVKVLIDGIMLDRAVREARDRELEASGDIFYKYLDCSMDVLSLGTTTVQTVTQANFNNTGNLAFAFVDLVQSNGLTNELQYTPQTLLTCELLQNSRVISHSLDDNGFTYDLAKLSAGSHWPNPKIMDSNYVFCVSFSDSPSAAVTDGSNWGYHRITGSSEAFRVTPNVSGQMQLNVYSFWNSYMKVNYSSNEIRVQRKPLDY